MNVPTRRLTERDICGGAIDNCNGQHCALGWGVAFYAPHRLPYGFGKPEDVPDDYSAFTRKLDEVIGHPLSVVTWNNSLVAAGRAHEVAAAINRTLDLLEMENAEPAPAPSPARSAARVEIGA